MERTGKSALDLKTYLQKLGLPGAISAASLFAAWMAIVLLLNNHLKYSIICAALAFVLDSLDGYTARKLNKVSELGRQLDSMVDLVGYSVYAGLLTYRILLPNWEGVVVGYAIVVFGLLRLIRFNIEGFTEQDDVRYYRGVVVCHLSLAAIALVLLSTWIKLPSLVTAIVLLGLAILQLSNIKTRKTGMLPFWYTIAALTTAGAIAWLP